MSEIIWGRWQVAHITKRHRVAPHDFEQAWHDPYRQDLAEHTHGIHGPYYVSVGRTEEGRSVQMVWRWQQQGGALVVWPITAFFPSRQSKHKWQRRRR